MLVEGSSRDQRLNLGCRDNTYVLQAWCAGIRRQALPEGINLVETTGGVETHVRREVIGFSERSPREKKKVKGMNSVHGRGRNE